MKKNFARLRNSGPYPSLESPDYDDNKGGIPKGWSSERVSLPSNSIRRHISASALMPVSVGRALPSKWDDAERWITSPLSGYGACRTSIKPESNSGPLGTSGLENLPDYSPTVPVLKGRGVRNLMASSPLMTGVLVPNGLSFGYDDGIALNMNSVYSSNSMARSTSMPDMLSDSSLSSSHGDKLDGTKEEETIVSRVVSRRDMATQMSPIGSAHSSPKGSLSFSVIPSSVPSSLEPHSNHSARDGVRDVQVDEPTIVDGHPIKRKMKKGSPCIKNLRSLWDVSEASRHQREEAKITAWENLQKAKAEAAIRKLEMELETKRSASTDKILNKLKAAQIKAQAMRDSISANHTQKALRTSHRVDFVN
ncbi:Remorin family protein [Forsythia ovata]|uniref:Remorin family protein n=1 Tax=Forsythia ovata TaxID=205694 RepID=A0ABD1WUL9_9LAMI